MQKACHWQPFCILWYAESLLPSAFFAYYGMPKACYRQPFLHTMVFKKSCRSLFGAYQFLQQPGIIFS